MAVMENLDEKEGDGRMPAKQIIKMEQVCM